MIIKVSPSKYKGKGPGNLMVNLANVILWCSTQLTGYTKPNNRNGV